MKIVALLPPAPTKLDWWLFTVSSMFSVHLQAPCSSLYSEEHCSQALSLPSVRNRTTEEHEDVWPSFFADSVSTEKAFSKPALKLVDPLAPILATALLALAMLAAVAWTKSRSDCALSIWSTEASPLKRTMEM